MKITVLIAAVVLVAGCATGPQTVDPWAHTRQVEGTVTVTTLLEDFDQGAPVIPLEARVDHWGDRIVSTASSVEVASGSAAEGGNAARFDFSASFDKPYSVAQEWRDSGFAFVARIWLDVPPDGSDGISLALQSEGSSVLELYLVQQVKDSTRVYGLRLFSSEGARQDWKVPFSSFAPGESAPPLDTTLPITLEVYVPFGDNWDAFHFRSGVGASATLLIDDVGYWRNTGTPDPASLESFDDERSLLPFAVVLYGSSVWVDYTRTDDGEVKINDGVRQQRLEARRAPRDGGGSFWLLEGTLELDPAIADFHERDQALTVFLTAPFGRPLGAARAISFDVRSDIVQGGWIEIQDEENDRYYGARFPIGEAWEPVRLPFAGFTTGDGTLADAPRVTDRPRLQIALELPPEIVERAAAAGVLEFRIALDNFRLEP